MRTIKNINTNKAENVLLTLVTLIACYFLGHILVSFFQSVILPYLGAIWQDEPTGFLSMAGIGAVTLKDAKGAEKHKDELIQPFTFEIVRTSTNKDAYKVTFQDNNERNLFLGLARIANILTFNYGFSKDFKTGIVGLLVNPVSESFVKGYANMTASKAMKIGEASLAERQKAKEAKKAEKEATKGTKKGSANGVSAVSAKIQALKDLFAEGLISAEVLADKIASIN